MEGAHLQYILAMNATVSTAWMDSILKLYLAAQIHEALCGKAFPPNLYWQYDFIDNRC